MSVTLLHKYFWVLVSGSCDYGHSLGCLGASSMENHHASLPATSTIPLGFLISLPAWLLESFILPEVPVNIDSKASLILTMLLRVDSWITKSYNFRVGNDLQVHLIRTSLSPGEKADLQGIGGIFQTGRECDYTWMRKHIYSFPVLNSFNHGIVRTQHVDSLGHR